MRWVNTIPLCGPESFASEWNLNPDGSVNLELRDCNGQTFWRGTFRPEAEAGT